MAFQPSLLRVSAKGLLVWPLLTAQPNQPIEVQRSSTSTQTSVFVNV